MALDVDRRTALVVVAAVAAVLALGVAAATLDTAVTPGGGDVPRGSSDPGSSDASTPTPEAEDDPTSTLTGPDIAYCAPWLDRPLVQWGIFVLFVLAAALGYWYTESVLVPITIFLAFGPPAVILHALLTFCPAGRGSAPEGSAGFPLNGSVFPGAGQTGLGGTGVTAPTTALGILLFLAIVAAVALLFVSTDDDEAASGETTAPTEPDAADEVAELGRVAGEAADRIEADADAENEIYRAWAEMTDLLDVPNPRSSTPAEFAEAAVDAGMTPDDVDELTALFEEVRYGGAEATADREERAVAALRRIEEAYAEDGGDA